MFDEILLGAVWTGVAVLIGFIIGVAVADMREQPKPPPPPPPHDWVSPETGTRLPNYVPDEWSEV